MKENCIKISQILTEASRTQLIAKSKSSDEYKDTSKGKNRWERKRLSKIATTAQDYNKIDMDAFWKGDILEFGIKVQGETNNYVVMIIFEEILEELRKQIQLNHNKLEFRCVLRALIKVFNSDNVYVSCSCPDWKYRQAFWATQGKYNSGQPQNDNGKRIANPNNTKGAGCKHVNLVLANLDWMMKIASVINNYIWYCKDNMENNYARYIFPQLYGKPYDDVVQMSLFDYDDKGELKPNMASDEDTINLVNALGRRRTQYKKAPQQSVNPRFVKPKKEEPESNELGIKFSNNIQSEETDND